MPSNIPKTKCSSMMEECPTRAAFSEPKGIRKPVARPTEGHRSTTLEKAHKSFHQLKQMTTGGAKGAAKGHPSEQKRQEKIKVGEKIMEQTVAKHFRHAPRNEKQWVAQSMGASNELYARALKEKNPVVRHMLQEGSRSFGHMAEHHEVMDLSLAMFQIKRGPGGSNREVRIQIFD